MSPESSSSVPPEQLLAQTLWLRRLAHHLLDDPHKAEDAVQDVMVAALEAPVRNWRGWLSRVLRRTVRRRRENARRRMQREALAARSQEAPPTDEIVAQAAMQRRVVGVVLEMNEPYRSAILLRYWADLSPKQVASRQQVPVDTVYSRLRRGLEMLRARLQEKDRDWRGALLPFALGRLLPLSAGSAAGSAAAGVASMSMSMPAKIATGAACALVALLVWQFVQDPVPGSPLEPKSDGGPQHMVGDASLAKARPLTGGATTLGGTRTRFASRPEAGEDEFLVRGVVRLFQGTPLSQVKVRGMVYRGYETEGEPGKEETLTTDKEGRFDWPLEPPKETVTLLFRSGQPETWRGYGRRMVVRGARYQQTSWFKPRPWTSSSVGACWRQAGSRWQGPWSTTALSRPVSRPGPTAATRCRHPR